MRLRQMQQIIMENRGALTVRLKDEKLPNDKPGKLLLHGDDIRRALLALREIPGFAPAVDVALTDRLISSGLDPIHASAGDVETLTNKLSLVNHLSGMALDFLNVAVSEPPRNAMAVRLPPMADLKELEAVIEDLRLALDVPVRAVTKGTIQLGSFDSGSWWIELLFLGAGGIVAASYGALVFGSAMVSKGLALTHRILEIKQSFEKMRVLSTVANSSEAIAENIIQLAKEGRREAAEELVKEHHGPALTAEERNEAVNITAAGLERLMELQQRSVHFYLNASAPKEAKQALSGADELMKQIERAAAVKALKEADWEYEVVDLPKTVPEERDEPDGDPENETTE
jgi:hypothetical protein